MGREAGMGDRGASWLDGADDGDRVISFPKKDLIMDGCIGLFLDLILLGAEAPSRSVS